MDSRFLSASFGAMALLLLCIVHSLMASSVPLVPIIPSEVVSVDVSLQSQQSPQDVAVAETVVANSAAEGTDEKQWSGGCMRNPCQSNDHCCKTSFCSFQVMILGRTGFCAPYGKLEITEVNVPAPHPVLARK